MMHESEKDRKHNFKRMINGPKQKPKQPTICKGWIFIHDEDGIIDESLTLGTRAQCWHVVTESVMPYYTLSECQQRGRVVRCEVKIL